MKNVRLLVAGLTVLAAAATAGDARAQSYSFTFGGAGVAGSLTLTYGAGTDAKYPTGYQITGISGTFTDTNNGLNIVNASVLGLVPIDRAAPEPTNLLAPNDFSHYSVASGLPDNRTFLSYDNLFWPGGSPAAATDYPFGGGILDIYGLLFDIGEGRTVNLWSNGVTPFAPFSYGAAVVTSNAALDYVEGGVQVAVTPEPGSLVLLGVGSVGLVGVLARRRRAATTA